MTVKSLSKKGHTISYLKGFIYLEEDVKEAVKELKKSIAEMKDIPPDVTAIFMKIDEIFGEELSK